MEITKHIVDDHDEIRDALKTAHETAEDFELFSKLVRTHLKAEESSLYPTLKNMDEFHDKIQENYEEHSTVEDLLNEMGGFRIDDSTWNENLGKLKEKLDIHLRDEEVDLFPRIKSALSEDRLEQLGESYLLQKEEAETVSGNEHHVRREEKTRESVT